MGTEVKQQKDVETHLEEALDVAENSETRYHIREVLQKLQIQGQVEA
jgi:hypothetical protein